jgi:hypothetical protein
MSQTPTRALYGVSTCNWPKAMDNWCKTIPKPGYPETPALLEPHLLHVYLNRPSAQVSGSLADGFLILRAELLPIDLDCRGGTSLRTNGLT